MAKLPNQGQKAIPLADWRRFLRVADWWDRTHGHKPPTAAEPYALIDPCMIVVKNSSGADRRKFDCLQLSATPLLTDTTREAIYVDGVTPALPGGPYCVLQETIKSGECGRAQIAGICPAYVDIKTADDDRCYVDAGDYTLSSAGYGPFEIVQKPTGTGEKLCVVRFGHDCGRWACWLYTGQVPKTESGWHYEYNPTSGPYYDTDTPKHPDFAEVDDAYGDAQLICQRDGWYPVHQNFQIVNYSGYYPGANHEYWAAVPCLDRAGVVLGADSIYDYIGLGENHGFPTSTSGLHLCHYRALDIVIAGFCPTNVRTDVDLNVRVYLTIGPRLHNY